MNVLFKKRNSTAGVKASLSWSFFFALVCPLIGVFASQTTVLAGIHRSAAIFPTVRPKENFGGATTANASQCASQWV